MKKIDKLRLEIEESEILVLWKVCQYYDQERQKDKMKINGYELEGREEENIFHKVSMILFHGACVFNLKKVEDFSEQIERATIKQQQKEMNVKPNDVENS